MMVEFTRGKSTIVEILKGYSTKHDIRIDVKSTIVEILKGYSTFHLNFFVEIYNSRNS